MTGGWWPQEVPPEVGGTLRALRGAALDADPSDRRETWGRFLGYVDLLTQAGWRSATIARHLGLSREALRQCRLGYPSLHDPAWSVPNAPTRPPRPAPAPRRKYLTDQEREELTALRLRSGRLRGQVAGTTRESDPNWIAGQEFATRVARLLAEGYTTYGIAHDLGVTHPAIRARLARHGLAAFPPSQAPRRPVGRQHVSGAS